MKRRTVTTRRSMLGLAPPKRAGGKRAENAARRSRERSRAAIRAFIAKGHVRMFHRAEFARMEDGVFVVPDMKDAYARGLVE